MSYCAGIFKPSAAQEIFKIFKLSGNQARRKFSKRRISL